MNTKTSVPVFPIATLVTAMLFLSVPTSANESLQLSSPAFSDNGSLPVQFSCEGEGISPPLNWRGVPDGAQSLVMIMDHQPEPKRARGEDHQPPPPPAKSKSANAPKPRGPEGVRWNWTLYNIPVDVTAISSGQSVGTLGSNVVNNKNEYAPPCSKGPGKKRYTFHLYALSSALEITQSTPLSEAVLRQRMQGLILDDASLSVSFERSCQLPPKEPPPKQGEHSDNKQPNNKTPEKRDPPPALPPCG